VEEEEERTSQLFRRPNTKTNLFEAALTFVPKLGLSAKAVVEER
jgi:hypothetical protein